MEDNKLLVTDDAGRQYEMTILFTFHDDGLGKDYVVYYDESDDAGQLYAAAYSEGGELFPVGEDEDELNRINDVIESYLADQEKVETK